MSETTAGGTTARSNTLKRRLRVLTALVVVGPVGLFLAGAWYGAPKPGEPSPQAVQLAGNHEGLGHALAVKARPVTRETARLESPFPCSPGIEQPAACRHAANLAVKGLHRDFRFIGAYTLGGLTWCLLGARMAPRGRRRRVLYAAAIAGVLTALIDCAENMLLFKALAPYTTDPGGSIPSDTWLQLAAVAATAKGALALVFVGGAVLGVVSFVRGRSVPPQPSPILDQARRWDPPVETAWDLAERGICFSGGGIRSAGFCLGVRQRLEEGDPVRGSALSPARYLAAVSGGGYLAGAAQLLAAKRRQEQVVDVSTEGTPAPSVFASGSAEEDHLRRHANYLADTAGEWATALGQAVGKLLANLFIVALVVMAVAQPLGWLGRHFLQTATHGPPRSWPHVPAAVGIAVAAMALPAIILAAARRRQPTRPQPAQEPCAAGSPGAANGHRPVETTAERGPKRLARRVRAETPAYRSGLAASLARALGAAALVLAITALALPFLDSAGRHLAARLHLPRGIPGGSWPAALIAATLGRVATKALRREAGGGAEPARDTDPPAPARRFQLPFANSLAEAAAGPLLVLVSIGYLAVFAAEARSSGPSGTLFHVWNTPVRSWVLAAAVAIVVVAFGYSVDAVNWSMHRFYKRRLWSAFAYDPATGSERSWAEPTLLSGHGARLRREDSRGENRPELVLCAAAQVSGPTLAPPGRRAVTFTFDANWVGGPEIGWCETTRLETTMADGGKGGDVSLFGALAISGAAFGSAMGRHSKGTLDAVLALANARLGVWLPNPAQLQAGRWRGGRRHLGYLAREVFGRYPPDGRWILVSDGGHYENLGLVELFRRRCTRILCFDASGDPSGALSTVAEALRLAEEELGVIVDVVQPWHAAPGSGSIPLATERLAQALDGRLARRPVVAGSITYPPASGLSGKERSGWIVVGRAVLNPDTPWPLLSYAAGHDDFPNDPTTDQWFDHEQFANYRLLGRSVAEHVASLLGHESSGWWPADRGHDDEGDKRRDTAPAADLVATTAMRPRAEPALPSVASGAPA